MTTKKGTCPDCSKCWHVCECRKVVDNTTILPTVAENALLADKCRGFVKIEPLDMRSSAYTVVEKINELVFTVNELTTIVNKIAGNAQNLEQGK